MVSVAVCIPVHGWSEKLRDTLSSIKDSEIDQTIALSVVLANSGEELVGISDEIIVIDVPDENYWVGGVCHLYQYVQRINVDYVVLMNHDCHPDKKCINELVMFAESHSRTIAHAVLAYKDKHEVVWWAGSIIGCFSPLRWVHAEEDIKHLPIQPYEIDSAMGQCLIMPLSAANCKYLHGKYLRHYYGDSVQTIEMYRDGYQLYLVPKAIAYTDQSDQEEKRQRIYPFSLKKIAASF